MRALRFGALTAPAAFIKAAVVVFVITTAARVRSQEATTEAPLQEALITPETTTPILLPRAQRAPRTQEGLGKKDEPASNVTTSNSIATAAAETETETTEAEAETGTGTGTASEQTKPTTESSGYKSDQEPVDDDRGRIGKLAVDIASSAVTTIIERLKPQVDNDLVSSEAAAFAENDDHAASAEALASATNSSTTDEPQQDMLDAYRKWRATGDDLIDLFSRKLLPELMQSAYEVDATTVAGIVRVYNGLRLFKPWALKLLDASAKLTPGLLVGSQSDFGDFDECLAVRAEVESATTNAADASAAQTEPQTKPEGSDASKPSIYGRYCIADVQVPTPSRRVSPLNSSLVEPIELRRPLYDFNDSPAFKDTIFVETGNFLHMLHVEPIRVGVCLTNELEPESVEKVVNKLLDEFKVAIKFRNRCTSKYDKLAWTDQQRYSLAIVATACLLVTVSTMLDLLRRKLTKLSVIPRGARQPLAHFLCSRQDLLTSFSLLRNTSRLFKTRSSSSGKLSAAPSGDSHASTNSSPSVGRRSSTTDSSLADSSAPLQPRAQLEAGAGGKQPPLASPAFNSPSSSSHRSDLSSAFELAAAIDLRCLHGVRVITMTWMIVNHTYLFGGFFVLWAHRRLLDIAEWPKSVSFQLVLNGWLTVETYFFLGATIIVLSVLPAVRERRFRYFRYVAHRLVRLVPAYVGLVCLNFLWPLLSSGPVWLVKGRQFVQTPCENYLWSNLLFVNNWLWPEKMCMVHTWFLSADFQLYLAAPLIVLLLARRPKLGHSINALVAIAGCLLSGVVIYANKLLPTTLINKLEFDILKQQLSYSYFATYQHLGPYCLGLFVGYSLHKRPFVELPRHLTAALWLLLPPLSVTTLLLTYLWNGAFDDPRLINPSPLISAIYVAIHRTIWISLVAWLVFAAATRRAKLLNAFLAHSVFVPLSRLSFAIYLVHLPVIMFRALNLRHTIEWTDANFLWEACGNFVASTIVAFFLNVAFESPLINLERALLGTSRTLSEPARGGSKPSKAASSGHLSASLPGPLNAQKEWPLRRQQVGASSPMQRALASSHCASLAALQLAARLQAQQYATLTRAQPEIVAGCEPSLGLREPSLKRSRFSPPQLARYALAPEAAQLPPALARNPPRRAAKYSSLTSVAGQWRRPVPTSPTLLDWLDAPPEARLVYGSIIPRVDAATLGRRRPQAACRDD